MLSSIPLYRYTTVNFSIHLLMDICVVSSFGLEQIKMLWTFMYQSSYGLVLFFFSLGKYLEVEGLDHTIGVMCNSLNEICQMAFHSGYSILCSTGRLWISSSFTSTPTFCGGNLFSFSHAGKLTVASHCGHTIWIGWSFSKSSGSCSVLHNSSFLNASLSSHIYSKQ